MSRYDARPKTPVILFVLLCVVLAAAAQAEAAAEARATSRVGDDACRGIGQFTQLLSRPAESVICALPVAASAWIARRR